MNTPLRGSPHEQHQDMGPGQEFDAIRLLMRRWGDLAVGIGDDAAVLPSVGTRTRVVSTDACVEGAHFRRGWIRPDEIGARAAAAALSDLAAMGARADAVLLAMTVPDEWREALGDIADGIARVVRPTGARIVGGNLSRGPALSITTTALGSATRPISRRGALPGDVLVVTGELGGPGSAVHAWDAGGAPSTWARRRFAAPEPRLAEGVALEEAGVHAMLDISDGLIADARHLAAASGVRLRIDGHRLPLGDGMTMLEALQSGEEYELLAAVPHTAATALLTMWPTRFSVSLTPVGRVVAHEPGGAVDVLDADGQVINGTGDGQRVEFTPGHDHFSG